MRSILMVLMLVAGLNASADEKLPSLKVGKEIYTNVTVIKVTAVDISFTHARGLGNAKLKDLEPDLQKHFHYDPAKANAVQEQRYQANAQYRETVLFAKPVAKPDTEIKDARPEVVVPVPQVYARRLLGGGPPEFIIEKWLTPQPDASGRFVLMVFWQTTSGVCVGSIPHLNALQAKFKDKLLVVGISDEPEATVRALKDPPIEFSLGIDAQRRMLQIVQVAGVPHALLVDPQGYVRFQGMPSYLTDEWMQKLIDRYTD